MNAKRLLAVLAGFGLAAAGLVGGSASADPSPPPPPYRALNGFGTDATTDQVMDGLSNAVTVNGSKVIASWDTTGPVPVQTEPSSACTFTTRSGGVTALLNSLRANDGCLQFARSSSLNLAATTPSLTYVPFAQENVTFMVTASSDVPRSLQPTDLQGIYTCSPNYAGIIPVLPQPGSELRSYWEGVLGITDADVNAGKYPCIWNGVTPGGQTIDENDGRVLTKDTVAPISVAQYIAEEEGAAADLRAQAVLGALATGNTVPPNSTFAITENLPQTITSGTSFPAPYNREFYNVIPTSDTATAPWSTVFVGSGSLICQQPGVIQSYGFIPAPDCGSTTNHT